MNAEQTLIDYTLRLADNALILGQRMVENVAAWPELEEELANANFALDFLGQARMLYSYAGELEGKGRSEDDFAYLRDEHEFRNVLLLEQPNGHFGDALVRQYLFEAAYVHILGALVECRDEQLSAIAARAIKEVQYHVRHTSKWLIRLGDGTELSQTRVQQSLHDVWRFTGELFAADDIDIAFQETFGGPDLSAVAALWRTDVAAVVSEATLVLPDDEWMATGGKQGRHSEHLGYLLAEMQYLPRSHAGATW
ncbi:MAG: phenylacetate-CoA oxygenase subunit PaaC [Gammaproteobacteria bacterium]|nr:phenylacetate-CoA oxygenase subunit PaaC [Gammaproteobacteria bacterium]